MGKIFHGTNGTSRSAGEATEPLVQLPGAFAPIGGTPFAPIGGTPGTPHDVAVDPGSGWPRRPFGAVVGVFAVSLAAHEALLMPGKD